MSVPYADIPLGRLFRDYVKSLIARQTTWLDYVYANGWEKRTGYLLANDWRQAAYDLGIDLTLEWFFFDGRKPFKFSHYPTSKLPEERS